MNDADYVPMVSSDGHFEKLQEKISSIQNNKLVVQKKAEEEWKKKKIAMCEENFAWAFIVLCRRYQKLSDNDLAHLNEDDLRALDDYIIKKRAQRRVMLSFLNPFFWFFGPCLFLTHFRHDLALNFIAFQYFLEKNEIRKYYGKKHFPASVIIRKLPSREKAT